VSGRRAGLGTAGLTVLIVWLVAVPLVLTVLRSVGLLADAGFTGQHLVRALASVRGLDSARNTAVFAGLSTLLATSIAAYLAWLTERTDLPWRRAVYVLVLVPVVVPGILTTAAWVLILHDRIGIANVVLGSVLPGVAPLFDAYTMTSMVWVDAIDSLTLPFLVIAAALRSMDHGLEEASLTSGASRWETLRHITLPLMAPAIWTATLLTLLRTVGTFAVPAAIGIPAGIRVLSTDVYIASRTTPRDLELGASFALLHVAIALILLALYQRSASSAERRYAVVGGRGRGHGRIALGSARRWHATVTGVFLTVAIVLPLLVMLWGSLLPYYQRPSLTSFSGLDLRNYRWAFESTLVRRAVRNTIIAGVVASGIAVALSLAIAHGAQRGGRVRRHLDTLSTVPIALPGTVLGLALMIVYLRVPLPIYATRWIIIIAFVTAFLPYAVRATAAALGQIADELQDASTVSGASQRQTLVRIVAPLLAPTLVVSALYILIRTVKALALPAILVGPNGELLSVLIYDLFTAGQYPRLNALGVLMVSALLILSLAAGALSRLWSADRRSADQRPLERAA